MTASHPRGYVFVEIEIHDAAGYRAEYLPRALAAVKLFEGRFLHTGKAAIVKTGHVEGHRIVLIEFASIEQALSFYDSDEYREAMAYRDKFATVHRYIILPGDRT